MKKPKTKTHTFWCVVDPIGIPRISSSKFWRGMSIEAYLDKYSEDKSWKAARKKGYTCQKFTITTKIK